MSAIIAKAFVQAQREFGPALKTATNPHFQSRYANLATCVEAVIDALNANGIALMQVFHEHERGVICETLFIHESGEQLSGGRLFMPAVKLDGHGMGSACTYARRQSLLAATGLAPEDDDANAASKKSDANAASSKPVPRISATQGAFEALSAARQNVIMDVVTAINDRFDADDEIAAYDEYTGITDPEEKIALWSKLRSNVRTALTKMNTQLKGKP